jgi:MFS transporter, MHS family, shikimate and dehydroshikimate transport protein
VVATGFTPSIAAWLVSRGHGSPWPVASYAALVAAIGLVCVALLPETRGRDLNADLARARPSGSPR